MLIILLKLASTALQRTFQFWIPPSIKPTVFFMCEGPLREEFDGSEKEGSLGSSPQNHSDLFAPAALIWLCWRRSEDRNS